MDPISLIIAALVAGAAAAAQETSKQAVKDAYGGLKGLLKRRFEQKNKPEGEVALEKHEEKPEVWAPPLKATLLEAAADKDEEIIQAAQKLMALVDPQQAALGKFILQAQNVQGVVQAERIDTLTQNFGNPPREK